MWPQDVCVFVEEGRMIKINVGCGPFRAEGWINTDLVETDTIKPDVIDSDLSSFDDEYADQIYLGHILEHIVWEEVPQFIDEVYRVLKPGGVLCIVGPDIWRALIQWKKGELSKKDLDTILEGNYGLNVWDGTRHYWNSSLERTLTVLDSNKWSIRQVGITGRELDQFPVVSRVQWQFGILATKK